MLFKDVDNQKKIFKEGGIIIDGKNYDVEFLGKNHIKFGLPVRVFKFNI